MKNTIMGRDLPISAVNDGEAVYQTDAEIDAAVADLLARAEKLLLRRAGREPIGSPMESKNLLIARLGGLKNEEFHMLFLDNQHRLIAAEAIFAGTINGCSVYTRPVVQAVLRHNAAAVILAHNHPSGVTEPSRADIQITGEIKNALSLIDARVLDHIIVSGTKATSMAEKGCI